MTGQIHDRVIFQEEEYSMISAGPGLIHPADFGLQPVMLHTACWRGYYTTYAVQDGMLWLVELALKTHSNEYAPIQGILPESAQLSSGKTYRGLQVPVHYSGEMHLGKDFLRERYVHMGFQSPEAFAVRVCLVFEDGRLVQAA
jgi:hypothetical protein